MARQVTGKQKAQRAKLIRGWLAQGETHSEIQRRCKAKYGFGIHVDTIHAIGAEAEDPVDEDEEGLVVASKSGLVPAREISPRLRKLLAEVADLMVDDGVLTVTIDGREISISYVPEELSFEL